MKKNIFLTVLSFNGVFLPIYLLTKNTSYFKIVIQCILVSCVFTLFWHFAFNKNNDNNNLDKKL